MRQIDANVGTRSNRPEGGIEFSFMNPNLGVGCVQELIQATGMVQVKMSDDDLLDVLDPIPGGLNRRTEFVAGLIVHTGEDIGRSRTPSSRIILATACLPKDQAFMRVINQDTVHRHLPAFVDKRFVFGALHAGVAATNNKSFITLQPSNLQDMELGAWRTDIGHSARDSALLELIQNRCHVGKA